MALIPCPECRSEVSSTAASCPRCGAPIAAKKKSGGGNFGCGSVIVLVLLLGVLSSLLSGERESTSPAPSGISVGDNVILSVSSGDVVVSVNRAAYLEFVKLAAAEDYVGMAVMETAGQLFRVSSGTSAKVISPGIDASEVRIMSGKHVARSGLVTRSLVHKQ